MGYNYQFVSGQALNTGFTSNAQQIIDSRGYAIQLSFSGSTCNFSASLNVSSDPLLNPDGSLAPAPTHFDPLANSAQTFTSAGTFTFNVNPAEYTFVQLVLVDNSSGANNGVLSATINVKGPLS